MTRALALAIGALLFAAPHAAPKPGPSKRAPQPPPAPQRPAPPLPSLPSVARVALEVSREHVLVVEDVAIPRGDWKSGDLDLYVAFGAPGVPEAIDARVLAVPDGALDPAPTDAGEPVAVEPAPVRPLRAQPLLGPPQMAGVILHVAEAAFRRAVAPGGMAVVRVRSLAPLPAEAPGGGREVLVRLGVARGEPLTLGRVQIADPDGAAPVARAEARLCGPDADPWPLAIAIVPRPPPSTRVPSSPPLAPIAPVLAVRHESDDLCIRWW